MSWPKSVEPIQWTQFRNIVKTGLFWLLLKSKYFKLLGADPWGHSPAPAVCTRHWMATTFRVWPGEERRWKIHASLMKLKWGPTMRASKPNLTNGQESSQELVGWRLQIDPDTYTILPHPCAMWRGDVDLLQLPIAPGLVKILTCRVKDEHKSYSKSLKSQRHLCAAFSACSSLHQSVSRGWEIPL